MHMKRLAPALAVPLAMAELAHSKEPCDAQVSAPAVSAETHTLALPHIHFDPATGTRATTVATLVASGAQSDSALFSLKIVPHSSEFRLEGRPTPTFRRVEQPLPSLQEPVYEIEPTQCMFGAVPVEALTELLGRSIYLRGKLWLSETSRLRVESK